MNKPSVVLKRDWWEGDVEVLLVAATRDVATQWAKTYAEEKLAREPSWRMNEVEGGFDIYDSEDRPGTSVYEIRVVQPAY